MSSQNLFKPLNVGNVDLENRVVMAPLTRFRADDNCVPTDLQRQYYEQRAQSPGTLLISEASYISPQAGGYPNVPGLWNEEQVKGWKRIIDAVHKRGSYFFIQMWALGRQAMEGPLKDQGFDVVSASDLALKNDPLGVGLIPAKPRALSKTEIDDYIEWYVNAAKNSIKAGADGVEIHSANGYLLDQFLHENSNHRTDEYGGSIENRSRFTLRVVDAVSEAVGSSRVGIRLSPWGTYGEVDPGVSPIPQYSYVITELQRRAEQGKPLAYIHVVEPRVSGTENNEKYTQVQEHFNDFVRFIWRGVIIRAGNLIHDARKFADSDDKTLVCIGRYFISNPDLVHRLKNGMELTKYDRNTFYSAKSPDGYITYENAS